MVRGALAASWVVAALVAMPVQAQMLPEVLVTRNQLADYEFDWGRDGVYCASCNGGAGNARLMHVDANNELWVANIDPNTGVFLPSNGRGELADTDAAQPLDFGNGPEWLNTAAGSQIVYVKYQPGMDHTAANAGLAIAQRNGGVWSAAFLANGAQRYLPLGSLDVDDPTPRLLYQNESGLKAYWRFVDDAASERLLPSARPVCSRRWVPGRHAVVYTAPCLLRATGTRPAQAYWLDLTTGVETPITSDASFKLYAFAWRAPEFGNDWVLFTVADRARLEVHREIDNGDGAKMWTRINTVTAPPATPFIASPESFVHNGKSYIAFQVSASASTTDFKVPTQIAITGIDPAVPTFRMLTADSTVGHVRLDPEYYITTQGPFIYYNRYVAATSAGPGKLEGVWRVDTGLGPPASH